MLNIYIYIEIICQCNYIFLLGNTSPYGCPGATEQQRRLNGIVCRIGPDGGQSLTV
jgi:hypothetical protein